MRVNMYLLLSVPLLMASHTLQPNHEPTKGLRPGELGVICRCYTGKQNKHYFELKKPGFGCDVCKEACQNEQPLWNRLIIPFNGYYTCTHVTKEEEWGNKNARIRAMK